MGKKMFTLIIFLMSLSLIGIITVQVFWIGNAIDIREKQFSKNIDIALVKASEAIYKKDVTDFVFKFKDLFETRQFAKKADITSFVYEQIDPTTNEKISFRSSSVYENQYYKGLDEFYKNDSILYESILSKNDIFKVKKINGSSQIKDVTVNIDKSNLEVIDENLVEKFTFYNSLSDIEKVSLQNAYNNKNTPIYKRLSKEIVEEKITQELKERGIGIDYKYAVFEGGLPTKVKSDYYKGKKGSTYKAKLFPQDREDRNYELCVTFPKKRHYIFSDIGGMLLLSIFFTIIIMLAFASSLYQLIKQKKISAIKTDFINNMTHEFKTPIATINLALDSIKNPKIISDKERVLRYVSMIKEENKRMNAQVENVLRISKLEKNQLDVSKTAIDFYEVVEDAMSHVDLLLKAKKGTINLTCNQKSSEGLGNEFHLTNVFVNILENAIKYSKDEPKIEVLLESSIKFLTIEVKDQGIGMSKAAQKQAFDKFYREQKGNVHNVKGHGLGLSYVKEIVEHHQGTVFVVSEKGKGSTFTVKLPLI